MTSADGDTETAGSPRTARRTRRAGRPHPPRCVPEITLASAPSADVTARVHEILAPAPVSVIWYEGSYSTHFDQPHEETREQHEPDTFCWVCRSGRRRGRTVRRRRPAQRSPPRATGNLCDRCHTLLLAGDLDTLAARLTLEDLPASDRRDLINRLR